MNFNHTTLALALFAAASTAVSPAHADEKILPGAICQPTSTGISAERSFYVGGRVINWTVTGQANAGDVRLHCPLVRDNPDERWNFAFVRVEDRSNVASVTCTLSNPGPADNGAYSITKSSGASFMGSSSLYFPAPAGDYNYTAFHVHCTVPRNTQSGKFGAVYSIRMSETEE